MESSQGTWQAHTTSNIRKAGYSLQQHPYPIDFNAFRIKLHCPLSNITMFLVLCPSPLRQREIVCFIGCLLDWSLPFLLFLCLPPFSAQGATQVIPIDFHYTVVSSPGVNKLGHIDGTWLIGPFWQQVCSIGPLLCEKGLCSRRSGL